VQQVWESVGRGNQVWQSSIVSPLNSDKKRGGTRFDGNKRVLGRKRHIVVDVLGLVLDMLHTAVDVKAAPAVWSGARCARIVLVLADKGYRGALATL